ncbi:PepSY domain-containing protein [Streptomyces sp. NPDC058646]|uniref:PepSY domain-containing protein n=1 Tax=Streptomyces sp. NPDC058646 TaxID=3346574 RepID=UPI003646D9A7
MKRNVYISAAAAVVLTVGGPVAAAAAATADTARTVPAATLVLPAAETAEEASAAALKHFPGVVEALDKDGTVWNVDMVSKDGATHVELKVAADGTVTEGDRDTNENASENQELIAAKVTADQAVKAAVAAHPGAVWTVEWDDDDAGNSWQVEVRGSDGSTWEGRVDPATGKVTAENAQNDTGRNGTDSN